MVQKRKSRNTIYIAKKADQKMSTHEAPAKHGSQISFTISDTLKCHVWHIFLACHLVYSNVWYLVYVLVFLVQYHLINIAKWQENQSWSICVFIKNEKGSKRTMENGSWVVNIMCKSNDNILTSHVSYAKYFIS